MREGPWRGPFVQTFNVELKDWKQNNWYRIHPFKATYLEWDQKWFSVQQIMWKFGEGILPYCYTMMRNKKSWQLQEFRKWLFKMICWKQLRRNTILVVETQKVQTTLKAFRLDIRFRWVQLFYRGDESSYKVTLWKVTVLRFCNQYGLQVLYYILETASCVCTRSDHTVYDFMKILRYDGNFTNT